MIKLAGVFPSEMTMTLEVRFRSSVVEVSASDEHCVLDGFIYELNLSEMVLVSESLRDIIESPPKISGPEFVELLSAASLSPFVIDEVERGIAVSEESHHLLSYPEDYGLKAQLYPYQVEGVAAMLRLSEANVGSLLGDEMGLGKTVQAIALICFERARGQSLVVCPGSLIENWRRELQIFAPSVTVSVHHGPNRLVTNKLFPKTEVVITTYETATADIAFLEEIDFNLVILDEAQMIKNADTARSTAVKRLARRAGIAVTGTPMENTLGDLWSISEFIHPRLLGRFEEFVAEFPDEVTTAQRLGTIMGQVTIRRWVEDVADDLPQLVQDQVPFELDNSTSERYRAAEATGSGLEINTTLRVIAAHAHEDEGDFAGANKNEYLRIQLDQILNRKEKAIIFCDFRRTLERLRDLISAVYVDVFVEIIDGSTELNTRQPLIDQFSGWESGGVLLLNPKAAGVGLNITAAPHVFHYSPNYNPAITEQATKRAHRRKQEKTVFVHHLYYLSTVEERAMEISEDKADLADAVDSGLTRD